MLQTTSTGDYRKTFEYLKLENTNNTYFDTYTPNEQNTHAFVVRGLDNAPTEEQLRNAFQDEHELELLKVYKMNTKDRQLYLIVTSSVITLRYLSKNIRYVLSVRITFEERRNNRNYTMPQLSIMGACNLDLLPRGSLRPMCRLPSN